MLKIFFGKLSHLNINCVTEYTILSANKPSVHQLTLPLIWELVLWRVIGRFKKSDNENILIKNLFYSLFLFLW